MLSGSYKPKPKIEISYFVNARQKVYKNSTEIFVPYFPYEKIRPGYELSKHTATQDSYKDLLEKPKPPSKVENNLDRTRRRAYTALKDIVLCNTFEMFATFTFKAERDDPEKCRLKLNGWLKRQRKIDKSFQYAAVAEFHKDRKSLHFHVLIRGYKGKVVRAINPKTGKNLVKHRRKVYDFPNYTLGHSEVYYIGDTEEDRIKAGFYLLKYMKKDMPAFKNKKRFWASRGLDRPVTTDNPEEWYLAVTPDHMITSPYGFFLFFDNKRIEIFLP